MIITPGTTGQSVRFTAFDDAGEAVTLTSASTSLAVYYQRWLKGVRLAETQVSSITDLATVGASHSDGGIIHDADGSHRLDLPDAAFAAGADEVRLRITATDLTGGIAHERITLQAASASQASLDELAGDVEAIDTVVDAIKDKTDQLADPASEVALVVNTGVGAGGKLYFRKADGFDETFAVAGAIASDDRIVLTVKADRKNDADDDAILKWDSAVGLVRVEGAAAIAADGSVAIVDATERTIRLILSASAAASLVPRANAVHYDVKRFPSGAEPYGVSVGIANIAHAVTYET